MSEVTIEQEKLATVLKNVQGFVKLGRNLFDTQFGEDIQEEAQKTASLLVQAREVEENDRETVTRQLAYDRKATCDGLRKLAHKIATLRQKIEDTPLGVGISKAASADEEELKPSERKWREKFGTPRI